jgi:hypothetical protein
VPISGLSDGYRGTRMRFEVAALGVYFVNVFSSRRREDMASFGIVTIIVEKILQAAT